MIAAGGTGGHVYPALAVAEAVKQTNPATSLYFVGSVGGFERSLVAESGLVFAAHDEVQAGPVHGVNPLRLLSSLGKLTIGTVQAFRVLSRHRPNVILSTGGWVSLPVSLVGWLRRVPIVIFLPDIEPGLTIKVLRLFATKVAVTLPESKVYFRDGQAVVTGYPLRPELVAATREQAIAHFDLDPARKTLLVFGGSRGARAINKLLEAILADILDLGVQVIHVTGTLDWERSQQAVGDLREHACYHAFDYLSDDMGLAFAIADLAVCRAGASTLAEFPFFELPSILIPLAYSWRYQQVNADYLAERGAAVHLPEETAAQDLLPTLRRLFEGPSQLTAMRDAAAALAEPNGAKNVADLLAQHARGDA